MGFWMGEVGWVGKGKRGGKREGEGGGGFWMWGKGRNYLIYEATALEGSSRLYWVWKFDWAVWLSTYSTWWRGEAIVFCGGGFPEGEREIDGIGFLEIQEMMGVLVKIREDEMFGWSVMD